jgi:S-methylmethionine-dependent homocysteine/selenocysteine methylase
VFAVRRAHYEYILAGAKVVTTNNYAVVPATLSLGGGQYTVGDLEQLTVAAAERAREAIDQAIAEQLIRPGEVTIAGSVPPLKASYRADLVGAHGEIFPVYERITAALAPHVDFFVAETMSKASEGRAAALAASAHGKPVWVAWTLAEDATASLRSGESVEEAFMTVRDIPHLEAVIVNCCDVASASAAMPVLRALAPAAVRVGAYANGFVSAQGDGQGSDYNEDLTPDAYAQEVLGWVDAGASVVGGCCGVFPEHIQRCREALDEVQQ